MNVVSTESVGMSESSGYEVAVVTIITSKSSVSVVVQDGRSHSFFLQTYPSIAIVA